MNTCEVDNFKTGDILYSCWGYNVSIVSYYKVLKRTAKGTFTLQKLKENIIKGDWMIGETIPGLPVPNGIITRRKTKHGHLWGKAQECELLYKWDGIPKSHNRLD